MRSLYEILGVSIDATPEEIRIAYKRLAMQLHPDKGGAEEVFKELKQAYEILSDAEKRIKYDLTGDVEALSKPSYDPHGDIYNVLNKIITKNINNVEYIDLISTCIAEFSNMLSQIDNAIQMKTVQMTRLNAVSARLSAKNGNNLLGSMLETQIENIKRDIFLDEDNKNKVQKAIEMLANYTYSYEPAQPTQPTFYSGGVWFTQL